MKKIQFWLATVMIFAFAFVGAVSRVSAQSAGSRVSPVRACVLRHLQANPELACHALDQFRSASASLAECQQAPAEPTAGHYCIVCAVRDDRIPSGCESYVGRLAAASTAPSLPPPVPVAPSPWQDAGASLIQDPVPAPSPALPPATSPDAAAAMDAAAAPAPVPTPTQTSATMATAIEDGYAVAVAPLPDGGRGVVTLNAETLCRLQGGYWDAQSRVPMERGRIQQGFCFTAEMQAYARAQGGMAENVPPEQVLSRIRESGYIRESRLREAVSQVQREESERRLALIQELSRDQRRMQLQMSQLAERDLERQRDRENFRRNFGLDLHLYGGGSAIGVGGPPPLFLGIGTDYLLPIGMRVSGVFGAGLGAGMMPDEHGLPQYQFFERAGLRYYHGWQVQVEERNGRRRMSDAQSFGFGGGIAGYQVLNAWDFRMQSHSFGGYLEAFARFAVGPARFRLGVLALVGPGYRETPQGRGGLLPDIAVIGSFGPEFRF